MLSKLGGELEACSTSAGWNFESVDIFTWWTSWVPGLEASAKAPDHGLIMAS